MISFTVYISFFQINMLSVFLCVVTFKLPNALMLFLKLNYVFLLTMFICFANSLISYMVFGQLNMYYLFVLSSLTTHYMHEKCLSDENLKRANTI